MHLTARDLHRLDAPEVAEDLEQSPAAIVCLSFSDSDLGALAAAHSARPNAPGLRLASLARLKHPYSVDMYLERTVAAARCVIVRCLGGADYWTYGVEQLARVCREKGIVLAIVPGDGRADERLDRASTVSAADLTLVWRFFDEGGPDNLDSLLTWAEAHLGHATSVPEPVEVPACGRISSACRLRHGDAPHALIVGYRSLFLAADLAPLDALADSLEGRGFAVEAMFVTSLKDPRVVPPLTEAIDRFGPDIVVNTTAFSAREGGAGLLDGADCPVIQAPLATVTREAWEASPRGLGAIDLAMNVVLPEVDGRLQSSPLSFKAPSTPDTEREFVRTVHAPHVDGIEAAVDLAAGWARLRRARPAQRKVALILSDYPLKGGREGYAVGLDSLASVEAIVSALRGEGYAIGSVPSAGDLLAAMHGDGSQISLVQYRALCTRLPQTLHDSVDAAWGAPEGDFACRDEGFKFRGVLADNLLIAFQPDRGTRDDRRDTYHDPALPPRHAYLAFYLWLRDVWQADAIVHLGTHGTLEWLPGKSVALSTDCVPLALTRGMPVIYPYVVSDPGEAAQARRRSGAVTIGHLTPPLVGAEGGEAEREIEALLDEYAAASGLDPRRAARIADAILVRAQDSGLAAESGIDTNTPRTDALGKLDAWLCDIKDLRIGDGLHVFGRQAPGEIAGLLTALDGRFVEPGPAGAPSRARTDVLPTGRNLFGIDPRSLPTRTAYTLGVAAADAVLARFVQDQGDWPRALMVDLWGSSTMRTGGEDFSQALALIGVRPVWDTVSARVSGFEILKGADLGRPRIDITLRISGLFRDVFPGLIELFDGAITAVAALDEDDDTNPLAAARRATGEKISPRIFGAAPGTYGTGISDRLARDRDASREMLGDIYLDAQSHAFTARTSAPDRDGFAARVRSCEALVHTQDMAETDVLAGAAFSEEEGGFSAAADLLGTDARVYHVDTTRDGQAKVRTLGEEVARVTRGKFASPRWIMGLMRHGHRGAGEIAEAVSNLATFAITANCVTDWLVDLAFDATLGNDDVRTFLDRMNPAARQSIAQDFVTLRDRALWTNRRNSVAVLLADSEDGRIAA